MKDVYDIITEVARQPEDYFALATLIRTKGSSYRRPGARMLICPDGRIIGSLSGGCLEQEVVARAREVLRSGLPAVMTFDTRKRFGCNGAIDIFVEKIASDHFKAIAEDLEARRSALAVTSFPGGRFVQTINPPLRLFIFGEGPDSMPLRQLCLTLGWRAIEAAELPFGAIQADEWTAAIIKTHNYGRDFATLRTLLPLNLRYVGLIGPRARRDQLMNDLLDAGVTINAGFYSPAGIDLGGEIPEQIALELVSEIQRVFAGGSGASLRERRARIHAASSSQPGSPPGVAPPQPGSLDSTDLIGRV
jgi:xanthine dehydrogenase accessory factor